MAAITGQVTLNQILLIEVDAAPGAGGGTPAPIGSRAFYNTGTAGLSYLKTGAADTAWSLTSSQSAPFTLGSIIFADSTGSLSQDNATIFWDNTNKRLGVNQNTPGYAVDVNGILNVSFTGANSSAVRIDCKGSVTNPGQLLFTNSAGTGDFIIGSDGGDIGWQGGGSRALQMFAYHNIDILGGRNTSTALPYTAGSNATYNTRIINSNDSIGLIVKGNATQTANLVEVRNSAETVVASILPTGLGNFNNAVRLGTTSDTTNGNVRYSGLDIEFYRNTWRSVSVAKNEFEDFNFVALGSGVNRYSVVSVASTGGATTIQGAATGNDYTGLVQAATGTTANATGTAAVDFFNSTARMRLGALAYSIEWRVRIPVLSTAGVGFQVRMGLQDTNTTGDPTNGVYFTYTHSLNAGTWTGVTRAASTSTTVNTTQVTVTAGTWYRVRAEVNAAGNNVDFYVDSGSGYTLIGSSTTNIPASTTGLRPVAKINKTSTSTTSSILDCDWCWWNAER